MMSTLAMNNTSHLFSSWKQFTNSFTRGVVLLPFIALLTTFPSFFPYFGTLLLTVLHTRMLEAHIVVLASLLNTLMILGIQVVVEGVADKYHIHLKKSLKLLFAYCGALWNTIVFLPVDDSISNYVIVCVYKVKIQKFAIRMHY